MNIQILHGNEIFIVFFIISGQLLCYYSASLILYILLRTLNTSEKDRSIKY